MDTFDSVEELSVDKKRVSEIFGKWSNSLRIPVVQREFEWDEENVKALIDSMIKAYPIGTIILWETFQDFPNSVLVGNESERDDGEPTRYVIDGQQRLLSLLLMKNNWKIKRGNEGLTIDKISYSDSTESLRVGSSIGVDVSLLINAAMAEPSALNELSRGYLDYDKAIGKIGRRIVNYEVPIYTLKTPKNANVNPETISEIFSRINRAGVTLGNLQVFLSFFAAAYPDLKDTLLSGYKELNKKYSSEYPSLEVDIRTAFGNIGISQNRITRVNSFRGVINEIQEEYKNKSTELKELIRNSFRAIDVGLNLIKEELGVSSQKYLPSQNVMVPIYIWLYKNKVYSHKDLEEPVKKHILKWILLASANEMYSSNASKKLQDSIDIIEEDSYFPLDNLLKQLKRDSKTVTIEDSTLFAYTYSKNTLMVLLAILHRKKASDWAGHPIDNPDLTVQHIFPRELLRVKFGTDDINALANVTLMHKSVNSEIKDQPPNEYLRRYLSDHKLLSDHMIPMDEYLWKYEAFTDFREKREEIIRKEVNKLLNSLP